MKKKTIALIKCPECGTEVSDKASSCPNCGSPIEKEIVCSECGEKLGPNDKVCPKCGCPVPADSNEKTAIAELATVDDSDERLQKVQNFLEKYFSENKDYIEELRPQLLTLNENQWAIVESIPFIKPSIMRLVGLGGPVGWDRFVLGDTKIAFIKLGLVEAFVLCIVIIQPFADFDNNLSFIFLVFWVALGIWWIYDNFHFRERTLTYNYKLLKNILNYV